MSYTVESINECTKKIVFNFETLDLTPEIKTAVVKKQKQVNIKGFRKGKAPLSMVEKMYGPQLETEALNSFVQNQLFEAINKEDLKVVGYPTFENMKYDSGKSVSFDAVIEVFPKVDLKDFSKLTFEKDKVEVTDEDVENVKKNYLSQKAEMVEVTDKPLENGLTAVMNFQGVKEDGSRPENMKGEEFLLEIGSGQFIPGFEDGMVGMKSGEKKNIDLTFPEDYHVDELKNAKVVFEVELLEIKEKKLPEFTDELAKEFGYESVDDFMTKNKELLTKQKDRAAKEKLHQAILDKLIEENTFDVPKAMVEQQEKYIQEDMTRNLKGQGFSDEMVGEYFTKWKDDVTSKALFQVKSGLILDTLAKEFNIEVSNDDYEGKIAEMAAGTGMDVAQIKSYYESNEQLKNNIKYAVREEKTFAAFTDKVKVTEK